MVIYSLGSAWNRQQAGVEHAISERHKTFDKLKEKNFIILTNDENELGMDNKFIVLNEVLQGEHKEYDIKQFIDNRISGLNEIIENNTTRHYVDSLGNKLYTVYVDDYIIKICDYMMDIVDEFTSRGYHRQLQGENKIFFDKDGKIVLIYNFKLRKYQVLVQNKVINLNFDEYVAYCLDKILKKGDILFYDRTDLLENLVNLIKTDIKHVLPIHNNHVASNDVKNERTLNGFYTYFLSNTNKFDKIITATKEQAKDIKERFNIKNVLTVPVGNIPTKVINKAKLSSRFDNTAVMFSRLAPDKQIEKVVESWYEVIKKHPDAILAIYGFDVMGGKQLIDEKISQFNLQDNVFVYDYIKDKDKIYEIELNTELYLLGSKGEGFNLGLMEALGAGCVGVSTDVKYGPAELIKNKKTGYVVEYDNFKQLSNRIIELFNDKNKLKKLRINSLDHMNKEFSDVALLGKWKEALNEINK